MRTSSGQGNEQVGPRSSNDSHKTPGSEPPTDCDAFAQEWDFNLTWNVSMHVVVHRNIVI